MRFEFIFGLILCSLCAFVESDSANAKVVCYYNGNSFIREGLGKVTLADVEPALAFCTHLVYGYAGIKGETSKMVSLNENLDLDQGKGQYRLVTGLKRKFPNLKILLSVGGNADVEETEKYLTILESSASRTSFVNSAIALLKAYGFDGIDLAWEFPTVKPKKIRSSTGSFFHKLKKTFSDGGVVDEKSEEHREEFTALLREMKNSFGKDPYQLSVTMLPNVNTSLYVDVPAIINYLDFVIVSAFDQQTPDRNPKEADFPAPINALNDRNPESNMDSQVSFWTSNKAPASKVVVGIPTYGRAWKMVEDSGITGVPPLPVDGPAPEGLQSATAGLMSWPEICARLPNPNNTHLKGDDAPVRKVGDPSKRYGSYAFRLPINKDHGLWIGYEDPLTSFNKAQYAKKKHLGGVAVFDISYDDFRGTCDGDKYPILRMAKFGLTN